MNPARSIAGRCGADEVVLDSVTRWCLLGVTGRRPGARTAPAMTLPSPAPGPPTMLFLAPNWMSTPLKPSGRGPSPCGFRPKMLFCTTLSLVPSCWMRIPVDGVPAMTFRSASAGVPTTLWLALLTMVIPEPPSVRCGATERRARVTADEVADDPVVGGTRTAELEVVEHVVDREAADDVAAGDDLESVEAVRGIADGGAVAADLDRNDGVADQRIGVGRAPGCV